MIIRQKIQEPIFYLYDSRERWYASRDSHVLELDIRFFYQAVYIHSVRVKSCSTDRENRLEFPEAGAYDSRCPRNCEPVSR